MNTNSPDDKTNRVRSSSFSTSSKKLGLPALTILIFYSVSGGAFGIEDIVRAGGPFFALWGFLLLLIWAVPEALVTAELSTAIPEASGSVAWVTIAFGPLWGFQKGWLSLLSGIADNSLYPILFLDCLLNLFSPGSAMEELLSDGAARWTFIMMATLVLTYLNYRGLELVGWVIIVICIMTLMPFLVFCVIGAFQIVPARWLIRPPGGVRGVNWRLFLNTFFWNINYWESAACYSGDVKNPGKTYPKGMALAMCLVALTTFLPVLVGTGASAMPYSEWRDGSFTRLANEIAGPWLSYWMIFASAITNIGMFVAEMSSDAWQIAGMADRGILPAKLGERNEFDTPTYGILFSASGILCLCWLSFSEVVDMLNLLFCFGQLIEFAAFIKLRMDFPDMHRPYKIPLGTSAMVAMLALPTFFVGVILCFSSRFSIVMSGGLIVLGFVVYYMLERAQRNNWWTFDNKFIHTCPSVINTATTSSNSGSGDVVMSDFEKNESTPLIS